MADKFFTNVITRHGCPSQVLTDQGRQFTSALFKNLTVKLGIQKLQTSALHPQDNGKAERFMRFLTDCIATSSQDQCEWDEILECCLFTYRTSVHKTIDETPFFFDLWTRCSIAVFSDL